MPEAARRAAEEARAAEEKRKQEKPRPCRSGTTKARSRASRKGGTKPRPKPVPAATCGAQRTHGQGHCRKRYRRSFPAQGR